MRIDVLTTLPDMLKGPLGQSILARAQSAGIVEIKLHNLRDWATDPHRSTDDHPYGGGPGMVMMIEPIDAALKALGAKKGTEGEMIVLTSAKGELFTQQTAVKWKKLKRLIVICGHYEGVDERVAENLVDTEIRIGDFVLTGGELPAAVMIDAVVRLLPGVLGEAESLTNESHNEPGYLEHPQYTRPENFNGQRVPNTLIEGNHKLIQQWKKDNSSKVK
ncbi:MAG TPA: tRNA (guanosine(37)-N1)-methyltransferase TrmD [Candidatus Saccharimonadia bacterium]|nr:tRNA (guanosine(37)-N1)-methyltransferase TrmD [Candidatus Saccharimonadia bacterium]